MFHVKHPPSLNLYKTVGGNIFNGDIRKERVAKVMTLASQLTVMEMKSVVLQLTHLHDTIVMQNDPKWIKPTRGE